MYSLFGLTIKKVLARMLKFGKDKVNTCPDCEQVSQVVMFPWQQSWLKIAF